MTTFNSDHNCLEKAKAFDEQDSLKKYREYFSIPEVNGRECLYFAGHSLGLMPKQTRDYLNHELDAWESLGVEGHFKGKFPWLPYHENLTEKMAALVGAQNNEVVIMNGLTTNLHLMMVSFYRPTKNKYKILIENNTFPSDQYAVSSQARFHGFDSEKAVIQLQPDAGSLTVSHESIMETIRANGSELALIMLGNVNYLSGQKFDFEAIVKEGHKHGCMVGFNLAHGAGNLLLELHNWDVDFAVWCTYKYLNSGPGGMAGIFVHERHGYDDGIPRFEGWWGHNKDTRFKMGPKFQAIGGAESWQLSNPPIFQLASLRSSLDIFTEASMPSIRKKGDHLTSYLEFLLKENCGENVEIVTPENDRGSMLSVRMKKDPKKLVETFTEVGAIVDFREPDILRMAPAPLYNNYEDVYRLVEIIKEGIND